MDVRVLALGLGRKGCLWVTAHWGQLGVVLQTLLWKRGVDLAWLLCTCPIFTLHEGFPRRCAGLRESLAHLFNRVALLSPQVSGPPRSMTQCERLVGWLSDLRRKVNCVCPSSGSPPQPEWPVWWNLVERSSEQVWRCLAQSLVARQLFELCALISLHL